MARVVHGFELVGGPVDIGDAQDGLVAVRHVFRVREYFEPAEIFTERDMLIDSQILVAEYQQPV